MTLAELAEAARVPARTIRFYIARGLMEGPAKAGRGAAYTPEHLSRLEQIRDLQSRGTTLSDIARAFSNPVRDRDVPDATAWWQHAIGEDVIVWVRAGENPWRTRRIRSAISEFSRRLQGIEEDTRKESETDE